MLMENDKPTVYTGDEGAAQLQIAIRYLHDIPNDKFTIEMEWGADCNYCERNINRLFKFINVSNDTKTLCPACIAHLGPNGVLKFLNENNE